MADGKRSGGNDPAYKQKRTSKPLAQTAPCFGQCKLPIATTSALSRNPKLAIPVPEREMLSIGFEAFDAMEMLPLALPLN